MWEAKKPFFLKLIWAIIFYTGRIFLNVGSELSKKLYDKMAKVQSLCKSNLLPSDGLHIILNLLEKWWSSGGLFQLGGDEAEVWRNVPGYGRRQPHSASTNLQTESHHWWNNWEIIQEGKAVYVSVFSLPSKLIAFKNKRFHCLANWVTIILCSLFRNFGEFNNYFSNPRIKYPTDTS